MANPKRLHLLPCGMIYAKLHNSRCQKYLYQALSLNPTFHPSLPVWLPTQSGIVRKKEMKAFLSAGIEMLRKPSRDRRNG